ncbi:hypothetical protein RJT34_16637 [Clitoria ternatea]|uniref:Uncharacterized protein n=1 Tax=Clitoria ternatea TaxID=43366 RepID=A0AAN9PDU6_CLITE
MLLQLSAKKQNSDDEEDGDGVELVNTQTHNKNYVDPTPSLPPPLYIHTLSLTLPEPSHLIAPLSLPPPPSLSIFPLFLPSFLPQYCVCNIRDNLSLIRISLNYCRSLLPSAL